MDTFQFKISKKLPNGRLGRAGVLETPHGSIETPAFVTVGTKATVKALTPEQVEGIGAQVVLANTYHLYLEPGDELVRDAGGLHTFMNWSGPTMTDSGGFQVFSLGEAFGTNVTKIAKGDSENTVKQDSSMLDGRPQLRNKTENESSEVDEEKGGHHETLATIDEDGVSFRSHKDGSKHRFTPERSIEIQHNIGADMIFAFDECTSPHATYDYQREAMNRTHAWAKRSLTAHKKLASRTPQALFGIVQGGRFEDLRKESARVIASMDFDGFGIGGSFDKEDMDTAVGWVNTLLPEEKPRHLLGIGEPSDLFGAIKNGCDLFDCVAPTRIARNGTLYTATGKINILNAKFTRDFLPIDDNCSCYTCTHYTRAYVSHLFRAKEMLASTLASIHNLYFIINLVKEIRLSILDGRFESYRDDFLSRYGN